MRDSDILSQRLEAPPPAWWAIQAIVRCLATRWILLAGLGGMAAVGWRTLGWAPDYSLLCLLLSGLYWLAAIWLDPLLTMLGPRLTGLGSSARWLWRAPSLLLLLSVASYALVTAPLALLLAYDQSAVLHSLRPLDIAELEIRITPLMIRMCCLAAPACLLFSLGVLGLLRRLTGHGNGTVLWSMIGVVLHSAVWREGPGAILPGSFIAIAEQVRRQLTNTDLLQSDVVFGPIYASVLALWLISLALLTSLSFLQRTPNFSVRPLIAALLAAYLSTALHAVQGMTAWQRDLTGGSMPNPTSLPLHFAAIALACWLVLRQASLAQTAHADLGQLRNLLPLSILLTLPALPGLINSPASVASFAAALASALACLLLGIGLGSIGTVRARGENSGLPLRQVPTLLAASAVLLLFFSPSANVSGQLATIPQELVAAVNSAVSRQEAIAVLAALAAAGIALCLLAMQSRMKLKLSPAPSSNPPG